MPARDRVRTTTIASVIRTATVASEYFRAAVSRSFPLVRFMQAYRRVVLLVAANASPTLGNSVTLHATAARRGFLAFDDPG